MDFDLDITQYEIADLERIFKLDANRTYTASEIQNRVSQFQEILLHTGHVSKHFKRDFIIFLQQAQTILIDRKTVKPKPHTSLPQNDQSSPDIPPPLKQPPPRPSRIDEFVERKQHHFTYAHPSEFVPGNLNPLETRTLKKCLTIDTRFRTNPYSTKSSDFIVSLPNCLKKVISLECISFEIAPKTIPNISSSLNNNFLHFTVKTDTETTHTKIITLEDGYYDLPQIIDSINTTLANDTDIFTMISLVVLNERTNKVSIDISSSSPISQFTLDFRKNASDTIDPRTDYFAKLGRILGFTKRYYKKDVNPDISTVVIQGETAANPFLDLAHFYLAVDDFQNRAAHNFEPAFSQMTFPTSTIARLGLLPSSDLHTRIEPLSIISTPRKYFGPVDINRLQIRLMDVYGNVLSMDGVDYAFSLLANTVYDV